MTTSNSYRPQLRRLAARVVADELGTYTPDATKDERVGRLAAWLRIPRETLCRVWMDDRRLNTSRYAGIVLTRFHGRRPSA